MGRRAPFGAWEDMGSEIELVSLEAETGRDDASEKEILDAAEGRLEVGRRHFRKERTLLAWGNFETVVEALKRAGDDEGASAAEDAERLQRLSVAAHLNVAACALKLGRYGDAVGACDLVLASAPSNVKGRFRRATAYLRLDNLDACGRDLWHLRTIDADAIKNVSVRRLCTEFRQARKEREEASREFCVRMCAALGRDDGSDDSTRRTWPDSPRGSESVGDTAEEGRSVEAP